VPIPRQQLDMFLSCLHQHSLLTPTHLPFACLPHINHFTGTVIQVLGEYDASAGTLVVTAPPESVDGGSAPPPPRRLLPPAPRKKTPPSPKRTPTDELYTSVYAFKSLTYILNMCGKTNNLTTTVSTGQWSTASHLIAPCSGVCSTRCVATRSCNPG
jgi:hypothetical protein